MGMAEAYRDYLEGSGVLTRLTEDDVKEDIPLYIETFGCTVTTEKFLSIPYDTEIPLTSFGDIQKMYDELSEEGVKNINFILTGYTKGGLENERIPYKLNWDKAVEKELDFEELLADAKSKGYGIYPDFDFVFCGNNQLFDGLSLNKHAIKTIDDRYTSKREYSATRQTFINYFELAMSPAYFDRFYTKLTDNYLEYDPIGISVSTLGSYLSSDFDEDEPYNREDSKDFTKTAFEYLDSKYNKVLTSGGNVYSWKYVDYITDAATDSSRHARSCATVPFLGIVLHGYVEFAGSAINMEGNIDYALLRAIENGASLKFILSYRNTQKLKQYYATSVYYSVRYDIWKEDLIARYKEINEVLKGVQTSVIVDHYFIDDYAVRIPDDNEIANDAMAALLAATLAEKAENDASRETLRQMIQTVRKNLLLCEQKLPNALNNRVNDTDELTIKDLFDAAVEAEGS
jgi:quinol monooxygenase YgiN